MFARDADGKPLAFDKTTGALADATRADIAPALVGTFKLSDGRSARPSFALIAERFLADEYEPERAAAATAIPADTIRRIARELAHAAFEQQVTLDIPWTDTDGRRHDKTVGRPVSMHAMRGISAHSNGFQTCRMLHLLQILLGSIDCPGGFRYKAPFPRPTPPPNRPARPSEPNTPLKGAPLGFPQGPEDLLVDADGKPQRIDKAYSWDAPLAAHGLMHMVITNAATADPYPVDVLFMYMANMSWNSSMNIPAVLRHLTAKDDKTGEYKIPKIIYSDAYSSEMVAYADLILPDTTYLERWDCISMLDRPISERRRAGRRDPPAGGRARPRRARLPEPCCSISARGWVAGLRHRRPAARAIPAAIRTTSSTTSAARASARSPASAARTARATAAARPTRSSSIPTSPAVASTSITSRRSSATTSTPTRPISSGRRTWASSAPRCR